MTKKKEVKTKDVAKKEVVKNERIFKFTRLHLGIAVIGIIGLTALLVYLGFFAFLTGDNAQSVLTTMGLGDSTNKQINNPETPTVILFYDPRTNGLSELESDLGELKNFFPDLTVEKKCVDYDVLMGNPKSNATDICITQHGEKGVQDVLAEAKARNIMDDNLFKNAGIYLMTSNKGSAKPLAYSPFMIPLKERICGNLDNALANCNNIEKIKPVKVKLVYDGNCTNCADVPLALINLSQLGFKYEITNRYNLADADSPGWTMQSAYGQKYAPFALIDVNSLSSFEPRIENILPYISLKADAYYVVPSTALGGKYIGPKFDSLRLDLYVMSYCPYGRAMEGIVAQVKKAAVDKLDVHPYFITYKDYPNPSENCESITMADGKDYQMCTMHGQNELTENRRQICIYNKYDDSKWLDYTTCFNSGKSSESCMSDLGINKTTIDGCMHSSDTDTLLYSQLNIALEKNISGSPTTLINGEKYVSARDSNVLLSTICQRLNDAPAGCDQVFDSSTPTTTGSC